MGLILGLTLGLPLLLSGLIVLCFIFTVYYSYKKRNPNGVITYTNAPPVSGGISTITPQHPYVNPAGMNAHQQGMPYPPGTQGQMFSYGTIHVQGAPYQQGIIYLQGTHEAQGPYLYPQGTIITPQNVPNQQDQPPEYASCVRQQT